jgi:hypothetical protein
MAGAQADQATAQAKEAQLDVRLITLLDGDNKTYLQLRADSAARKVSVAQRQHRLHVVTQWSHLSGFSLLC